MLRGPSAVSESSELSELLISITVLSTQMTEVSELFESRSLSSMQIGSGAFDGVNGNDKDDDDDDDDDDGNGAVTAMNLLIRFKILLVSGEPFCVSKVSD